MIIFAVVVGAIYWQIDDSCTSGLQNRYGSDKLLIGYYSCDLFKV